MCGAIVSDVAWQKPRGGEILHGVRSALCAWSLDSLLRTWYPTNSRGGAGFERLMAPSAGCIKIQGIKTIIEPLYGEIRNIKCQASLKS